MNERRIARIQQQIKERVATALVHEIADPRLGFGTISRGVMDKEMQLCEVFWSSLGDDKAQRELDRHGQEHERRGASHRRPETLVREDACVVRAADPVRQGRAFDPDAMPGEDLRLTV